MPNNESRVTILDIAGKANVPQHRFTCSAELDWRCAAKACAVMQAVAELITGPTSLPRAWPAGSP